MFKAIEYQQEAIDYGLADDGSPILCAPTGSGKTLIAQQTPIIGTRKAQ